MKILAPRDNALFMRCWRSRARPANLVLWLAMSFLISMLVVMGCFVVSWNPRSFGDVPWPRVAFGILVALQALVLLVVGTAHAEAAASSEAFTGAMDFHRASATSFGNQALGLIFGPAAVDYLCFAAILPAELLCVILGGVTPGGFVQVLVSLALTAVFFQIIAVGVGLRPNMKTKAVPQQGGAAVIVPILLGAVAIPLSYTPWSLAGSLVGYPVIAAALGETEHIGSALFGLSLPPLTVQLVAQLPLLALAALAVRRAVAYPTRPPLSKRLSLVLAFWLFVLFACAVTNAWDKLRDGRTVISGGQIEQEMGDRHMVEIAALIFAFIVGAIAVAYSATPSYALFCNGLRRRRKLKLTAAVPLEDAAGNSSWMLRYAALVAVMHFGLVVALGGAFVLDGWLLLVPLAVMLLSLGWFASAVEYHRLGPARGKGAWIPTIIAVLWVVLPLFALITQATAESGWARWSSCIMSACPIFSVAATSCFALGTGDGKVPADYGTALIVLIVNAAFFLFFARLAWIARRNAARRALAENGSPAAAAVATQV